MLYIIAHTWKDTDLTIEVCHTRFKAIRYLSELLSDEFGRKADAYDDPMEYLQDFYTFVREEKDNFCDNCVAMEIVDLNS